MNLIAVLLVWARNQTGAKNCLCQNWLLSYAANFYNAADGICLKYFNISRLSDL
jgi:hypothetical protein